MKNFEKRKVEICGHLLVKASRLFFSKSVEEIVERSSLNLTENHFRVFPYLEHEGTTVTEISKKMKISKQAVSKLIQRLVAEGVLYFTESADGREKIVKFRSSKNSSFDRSLNYLQEQEEVFAQILGGKKDLKKFKEYLLLVQNHYS